MDKNDLEVYTVQEVAEILRIGKNKAYALIKSGCLSSIRIGGKTIVPRTCVQSFLDDKNNYKKITV